MNNSEVRPNAALLSLLTGLAMIVGATPYLFYIEKLWLLPLPAVIAAAAVWRKVMNLRGHSSFEPTPGEWIAAGWSLVGSAAMITLALIYYAIMYWLMRLVIYLLTLIELQLDIAWAGSVGLYVSAFFALGLSAAAIMNAMEMPRRLYPRLAGVRSPYYALWLTKRGWITLAMIAGLSALAMMVLLDLRAWYWILVCSVLLFYTGFPIAQSGEEREMRRKNGLQATRLLLNATGWKVEPLEATGDPEVDPFTDNIDYIARRDRDSLLVEVVAAEVDWTIASGLQTSAYILQDQLDEQESDSTGLRPLLVLVNDRIDQGLARFAEMERFDLAHIPEASLRQVIDAKNDSNRLLALAVELIPAAGGAHG